MMGRGLLDLNKCSERQFTKQCCQYKCDNQLRMRKFEQRLSETMSIKNERLVSVQRKEMLNPNKTLANISVRLDVQECEMQMSQLDICFVLNLIFRAFFEQKRQMVHTNNTLDNKMVRPPQKMQREIMNSLMRWYSCANKWQFFV